MKTSVAITLIICGTVLILAPLVLSAASSAGGDFTYLPSVLGGIAMILGGTMGALKSKT